MIEQDIHRLLQDVVQIEYVIHDERAVYLKFRTPHLNQTLMDEIQNRVAALGLRVVVSNLSTEASALDSQDVVILQFQKNDDGRTASVRARRWFASPGWQWMSHPAVNAILFVVTFGVVFVTGASTIINRTIADEWNWTMGFQFSVSLLGILLAHEFGHYFAARYHGLEVSLPYFLPGIIIPPWILAGFGGTTVPPGTFGAFIRIKSPIRNKRQLMDVGSAGPIAGFVVCLAVLVYGFSTLPVKEWAYQFYDRQSVFDGSPVMHFGSSLLFRFLADAIGADRMPEMYDIIHYPFLLAGWFGLLVTALNLLPIGQLDGGHILYALLGRRQKYVAYAAFGVILFMGIFMDIRSWLMWAVLILVLIRIHHPPVVDEDTPLDSKRMAMGWASIIIFVLAFIPAPIFEAVVSK